MLQVRDHFFDVVHFVEGKFLPVENIYLSVAVVVATHTRLLNLDAESITRIVHMNGKPAHACVRFLSFLRNGKQVSLTRDDSFDLFAYNAYGTLLRISP